MWWSQINKDIAQNRCLMYTHLQKGVGVVDFMVNMIIHIMLSSYFWTLLLILRKLLARDLELSALGPPIIEKLSDLEINYFHQNIILFTECDCYWRWFGFSKQSCVCGYQRGCNEGYIYRLACVQYTSHAVVSNSTHMQVNYVECIIDIILLVFAVQVCMVIKWLQVELFFLFDCLLKWSYSTLKR